MGFLSVISNIGKTAAETLGKAVVKSGGEAKTLKTSAKLAKGGEVAKTLVSGGETVEKVGLMTKVSTASGKYADAVGNSARWLVPSAAVAGGTVLTLYGAGGGAAGLAAGIDKFKQAINASPSDNQERYSTETAKTSAEVAAQQLKTAQGALSLYQKEMLINPNAGSPYANSVFGGGTSSNADVVKSNNTASMVGTATFGAVAIAALVAGALIYSSYNKKHASAV